MVLEFKIDQATIDNTPIIRVKGEIDLYTCPQLSESLMKLAEIGHTFVVLNLSDTQYIDSTGLGVIAQCAHKLNKAQRKIHVVCTKPQIKQIFDVSGLANKNVTLFDDEPSALKLVPAS